MKMITIISFILFYAIDICAQTETFDLTTFTPPKGWTKEVKENFISFTKTDDAKKTWCQIGIYRSIISKGNIEADFESEWQLLIAGPYKVTEAAQVHEEQEAEGWKIKTGTGNFIFNKITSSAMLTTMMGYKRCVSIVVITNSGDYIAQIQNLLESVDLKKPANDSAPLTNSENNNAVIAGTWGKKAGANPSYADPVATGNAGYSKDQYTFNTDGFYSFVAKTFRYSSNKILLIKENGSYQITGNNLIINPKKAIIEAWSKKDGTDKWGSLLSTQNRSLENATYTFTKHYFSGIQVWNLVLQSTRVTERDGPFSNNTTFNNAWYYAPISSTNPLIDLPVR